MARILWPLLNVLVKWYLNSRKYEEENTLDTNANEYNKTNNKTGSHSLSCQ